MSYEVISGFGEFNGDKYYKVTKIRAPLTFEWKRDYLVSKEAINKFVPYIKEFTYESAVTQTEEIYGIDELQKEEKEPSKMPAQRQIFPSLKNFRESRKIKHSFIPIKILTIDVQNNSVVVLYPDSSDTCIVPYNEAIMVFPNLIAEYLLNTEVNH